MAIMAWLISGTFADCLTKTLYHTCSDLGMRYLLNLDDSFSRFIHLVTPMIHLTFGECNESGDISSIRVHNAP